ncbi:hypothetical protein L1277_000034 [Okibacterium sp. HSC-33S16]|uniref:hypothetical protein n=1 Tax=Okibacterium sp. HSC-33S16 TaxID=2910965 RepID=UPI00209D60BF|nr:hypothetical protein [Okibacterium sp. HSC-33S16]MCP2029970.1 hypothetical protein [Okibacterium sp. HSC-33S16]
MSRGNKNERGAALTMVIVIGAVLMMLIATSTAFSLSSLRKSSTDADWNGAMAAVYAGVEDYKSKLSNDNAYVKYGNKLAPFSVGSDLQLPTGVMTNPAFGLGTAGTWATVSGSNGTASYRYEVDNSKYSASGILRLRSTGRVNDSIRTLVVNVKQQGFIDYLYFTDYEIVDPAQQQNSNCVVTHAWEQNDNEHKNYCTEIQFAPGDVINGPMHSNDTLLICGTRFKGQVTTSNNKLPIYRKASNSGCTPTFEVPGSPEFSTSIGMPATNSEMRSETRTDLPDIVTRPGCLYTGPTVITFLNGGLMNVKSPFTVKTRIAGAPATSGTTPAECGVPGTSAGSLGSSGGATIAVIEQNLIYVQNVPGLSDDPNYTAPTSSPTGFTCTTATGKKGWSFGGNQFPLADEIIPWAEPAHYGCRNGDAYIKGKLGGQVSVAAENYVYVTGDLTYSDETADMLGIVGQNAVWVWNPLICEEYYSNNGNGAKNGTCKENKREFSLPKNRTISGAILSVAHTFMVQNYDLEDSRGKLTVKGAISQKFRGTVATTSGSGYVKDYNYDPRFRFMAPPKFLSPVSTTYGISELVEVSAAFKPNGVAN